MLSNWRSLQFLLSLLQLQKLVLALKCHQLLLVPFLHGLHRLLKLLAVLAKLLVLGEKCHRLLLGRLTALLSLHLGDLKLLDLIMHTPHDLLFNFADLEPLGLLVRGADL